MNDLPAWMEYQWCVDAAKQRAHALRDQAIDQLWSDAGQRAARAARRLAAALARHRRPPRAVEG